MSRQRAKGTAFETACVNFLRDRLGDERIERRALHGVRDMGDIYRLFAHGHEGIAECKDYKTWGKADLDKWKQQTVAERENAGADFALLIVHESGVGKKRFGQNSCHMQVRDLEKVIGSEFRCVAGESAMGMWVRVALDDACMMMGGVYEDE